MISPKFVNIAREVIKFIRVGNKLSGGSIYFRDNKCCPLGAVCVNRNHRSSFCEDKYQFAYDQTNFSDKFEQGFDYYEDFKKVKHRESINQKYFESEDFLIGYKLAEMCDKRNWIVE